jgi:hypothetical protein
MSTGVRCWFACPRELCNGTSVVPIPSRSDLLYDITACHPAWESGRLQSDTVIVVILGTFPVPQCRSFAGIPVCELVHCSPLTSGICRYEMGAHTSDHYVRCRYQFSDTVVNISLHATGGMVVQSNNEKSVSDTNLQGLLYSFLLSMLVEYTTCMIT